MALQFLELLRDMLAFVALLILAVTLVRLPKVGGETSTKRVFTASSESFTVRSESWWHRLCHRGIARKHRLTSLISASFG